MQPLSFFFSAVLTTASTPPSTMPACRCGLPALQRTCTKSGPNNGRPYFACPRGERGCGTFLGFSDCAEAMNKCDLRAETPSGLPVVSLCRPFETPCMWADMRCDCGLPMVVKRVAIGRFTISVPSCGTGQCKASHKIFLPNASARLIAGAEQRAEIPLELFSNEALLIKNCKTALVANVTTL